MDFIENKPIYLQLADQLMNETEQPGFAPGSRLPSVRDYASQTGVNANTVMRTYTWLQQEDIIFNKRGIGYFYCEDAREKVSTMRRKQFLEKEVPYFLERMKVLGISMTDLEIIYKSKQDK